MKNALSRGLAPIEASLDRLKHRLARKWGYDDPICVLPYRGFGTRERLWVRGRVLQSRGIRGAEGESTLDNLVSMVKRYESDEIPNARLRATLGEHTRELRTDDEGYFEIEIDHPDGAAVRSPWTDLELCLLEPLAEDQDNPSVTAHVRVPDERAKLGIVSDMDDTVVKSGVTDALKHIRIVLLNNAKTREPFDGVSAFYRALVDGRGGNEDNPIFYVSSSPYNIYDLFESFLELHDIPLGPILLKEFGLERGMLLKKGHVEYKADRIGRILDTYPDLPFILLGDSGQKDAWVFEDVVSEHPDRVLAAYLRDLNREKPDPKIEEVERRVAERGVPMLRVHDTAEAAEHAADNGWISDAQLREVREAVESG